MKNGTNVLDCYVLAGAYGATVSHVEAYNANNTVTNAFCLNGYGGNVGINNVTVCSPDNNNVRVNVSNIAKSQCGDNSISADLQAINGVNTSDVASTATSWSVQVYISNFEAPAFLWKVHVLHRSTLHIS